MDKDEKDIVKNEKEESIINSIMNKIDFSQYLNNDYIDVEVVIIPNKLKVTYRSPRAGDAFDADAAVKELELSTHNEEYNYRFFRMLAASVQSINGTQYMPGASVPAKIEGLKLKPRHITDRMFWGHSLFEEALNRIVQDPECLDEKIKK